MSITSIGTHFPKKFILASSWFTSPSLSRVCRVSALSLDQKNIVTDLIGAVPANCIAAAIGWNTGRIRIFVMLVSIEWAHHASHCGDWRRAHPDQPYFTAVTM